jgi:hypothetical protein
MRMLVVVVEFVRLFAGYPKIVFERLPDEWKTKYCRFACLTGGGKHTRRVVP